MKLTQLLNILYYFRHGSYLNAKYFEKFISSKYKIMIRLLTLFIACFLFSACNQAQQIPLAKEKKVPAVNVQKGPDYSVAIEQSRLLSQKTLKNNKLPGIAVAVSIKGKMVWQEGFGYADISENIAVDPSLSKFRVGSISKPFTATALGLLFEQNKLDFDAPVQKYVTYFPKKKYSLSVRQVAGHIGGIRHYQGDEFMSNEFYDSVKKSLGIFQDDPLLFEPGLKMSYSSYGWNLMSAVVEGASGESFLVYMNKYVFDPLNMENTRADINHEKTANRVVFYELKNNKIEVAPVVDNSYKWAGGGFLSSAEDVVKFGNAYLQKRIFSEKTIQELWKPLTTNDGKSTNYGIGWRKGEDKKGRLWMGHSGGSIGGTSMLMLYPEQEMVVVVLCNMSSAKMDQLPFRVAEQFLSIE